MSVKKLSKKQIVIISTSVVLVAVGFLSKGLIAKRAVEFKDCVAAKYDLRRETNFRFLTGACTAIGKDGGQVYVNQLRAFGDDASN